VDARGFLLNALPRSLPTMHRACIADWQTGQYPVKRMQHVAFWPVMLVRILVFFRNLCNRIMGLP